MWENLDSGDIPMALAIIGLSNRKAPTNGNDADVIKYQTDAQVEIAKTEANSNLVQTLVGGAFKTVLGYKGLDVAETGISTLGAIVSSTRPSNTVNVDNGSTYQGAQDESSFEGLPFSPVETEPVAFGTRTIEEGECPAGFNPVEADDPRFPGCSDGSGGFVPLPSE